MAEPELRNCPFCGDNQQLNYVELSNGLHYVECKRCGAAPHRLGAWDRETAVKYWNSGNRWIPVEDALPEKDGEYLVFTEYEDVFKCTFDSNEENKWGFEQDYRDPDTLGWAGTTWTAVETVTHWMPLPEPPKEDET